MARRIAVTLDLDAQPYVDAAAKSAATTKALDEEMKGLDREVSTLERKMDNFAITNAVAAKEVDHLGDEARGTALDFTALDRHLVVSEASAKRLAAQIETSTARLKELRLEAARGGGVTIFRDIRREETRLRNLGKTLDALMPDFVKAGVDIGATFGTAITNSFSTQLRTAFSGEGGGAGIAALGGAVGGLLTALLPPLGAAIAGAVVGTVGTGGLVGGVLAASKNPLVQGAFATFLGDVERTFFTAGDSFVEPIRKSLAVLDKDFANLHLDETFARAAPDLQIIVQGVGDLVKNLMPGLNRLLDRSGPFAATAAKGFGDLGRAFSEFLDHVSASHGAVEGLAFLFDVLSGTIKFVGVNLHALSEIFHAFNVFMHGFWGVVDKSLDMMGKHSDFVHKGVLALDEMTHSGDGAAQAIDGLSGAEQQAADAMKIFNDQLIAQVSLEEEIINKALALDDANVAVAQGWLDLNEKLHRGKGNWDENTQAGVDNLKMIYNQIGALDRARQAKLAESDGSIAAINAINAEYDKQLAQLEKVAAAAGDSKANLEALAKKYYIDIIVTREERNQLNKAAAVDKAMSALGFAGGGVTPAFTPFWVGENQPELMFSDQQHYVATKQMMAQPWNGGGMSGGAPVIQNNIYLVDPTTGTVTRARLINEGQSRGVPSSTLKVAYP